MKSKKNLTILTDDSPTPMIPMVFDSTTLMLMVGPKDPVQVSGGYPTRGTTADDQDVADRGRHQGAPLEWGGTEGVSRVRQCLRMDLRLNRA